MVRVDELLNSRVDQMYRLQVAQKAINYHCVLIQQEAWRSSPLFHQKEMV